MNNIIDKDCNLINHWEIKSVHTQFTASEISRDPYTADIFWINVGFVCPVIVLGEDRITINLANNAKSYINKFN
jgi:hypothetical protein